LNSKDDRRAKFGPRIWTTCCIQVCIGIDDYPGNQRLQNGKADAEDTRNCCEYQYGFQCGESSNKSKTVELQALWELREFIQDGSLVFSFFSGHGVEHEGVNYILPLGKKNLASV
jgi:hypothetical protein